MRNTLNSHYQVWRLTAINAVQETFVNRGTNALFLLGKLIRFGMTLLFLLIIKNNVTEFSGYTTDQVIVFYLTYQLVDTIVQIFYRGVYVFSNLVRTGEFDFYLLKPVNPLFRALTGKPDINDLVFLLPTVGIMIYLLSQLNLTITLTSVGLYLALLLNSFLIATALHIIVLSVGIVTIDIDGMIWLYRDLSRLGQFPITIYLEPIRLALFFLVPIGFMITIPAQALTGLELSYGVGITTSFGLVFLVISLWIWKISLRRYSSASS